MTPPALELDGLRIETLAGAPIVEEAELAIGAGEVLSLVGESGSGKTALGLALMGYARPGTRIAAGRARVAGTDMLRLAGAALRRARGARVAYVPQDPPTALDPRIRVGAQIAEMFAEHPEARPSDPGAEVARLLDAVGLSAAVHARRFPFELSGGQQQRVAIAMALACRPALVVLDEPTTGLDPIIQARILDLVRALARATGTAFLHITHDLAAVARVADRVAVLYAGRLAEVGPAEAVIAAPAHPYAAALIAAAPRLDAAGLPEGIPGGAPPPGAAGPGCAFAPRCTAATAACAAPPPPRPVASGRTAWCHHPLTAAGARRPGSPRPTAAGRLLLAAEGLAAHHGRGAERRQVLSDIGLALAEGECLAVVGESGSGKSTLARVLTGLHPASAGRILWEGQPLAPAFADRGPAARRALQMVFQSPDRCLNPARRVGETIARALRIAGTGETPEAAAARAGLGADLLARFPHQLSGGQRQRVAIAAAVALGPRVLICDEVTSALDVSVQAGVVQLLDGLRRKGMALVFITHDLALVASVADRVMVLRSGRIVEAGPVAAVAGNPRDSYTRALFEASAA